MKIDVKAYKYQYGGIGLLSIPKSSLIPLLLLTLLANITFNNIKIK